jgi:threonine/homoserine/homoserine lactone efflux protein
VVCFGCMSAEQVYAFVVFAFVAAATPGPSNVMLTATGASVGVARGLPALAGVGMGSMMAVVAFGLGSVVLGSPTVLAALKWCGAAFLLWLSWKIATADTSGPSGGGRPVGLFGAALFQWVNPKGWLVSASAAGTYLDEGAGSAFTQANVPLSGAPLAARPLQRRVRRRPSRRRSRTGRHTPAAKAHRR